MIILQILRLEVINGFKICQSIVWLVTSYSIKFFPYKFNLYKDIQEDANLFVKIFANIEGEIY